LRIGAQYRAALIAGIIAFTVHLLLVIGVLYLDLTDPSRQAITVWNLVAALDLPTSKIVYLLDPSYGVPVAVAFAIIGGIHWFVILAAITLILKREGRKPS